jgi:hypothetical protein
MATNTFVPIYIPEAQALADLRGVGVDLETASRFAQRCMAAMSKQVEWDLIEPLSTATLAVYARPFSTGVRKWKWQEALSVLNEGQRSWHIYLMDIRNKHIAHSANAFEENQPIARYWVERVHEQGIEAIECSARRVVGLSADDLDAVIELTAVLGAKVNSLEDAEKARLLAIVRAMPLGEVLAGKHRTHSGTDPATAAKRRPLL